MSTGKKSKFDFYTMATMPIPEKAATPPGAEMLNPQPKEGSNKRVGGQEARGNKLRRALEVRSTHTHACSLSHAHNTMLMCSPYLASGEKRQCLHSGGSAPLIDTHRNPRSDTSHGPQRLRCTQKIKSNSHCHCSQNSFYHTPSSALRAKHVRDPNPVSIRCMGSAYPPHHPLRRPHTLISPLFGQEELKRAPMDIMDPEEPEMTWGKLTLTVGFNPTTGKKWADKITKDDFVAQVYAKMAVKAGQHRTDCTPYAPVLAVRYPYAPVLAVRYRSARIPVVLYRNKYMKCTTTAYASYAPVLAVQYRNERIMVVLYHGPGSSHSSNEHVFRHEPPD